MEWLAEYYIYIFAAIVIISVLAFCCYVVPISMFLAGYFSGIKLAVMKPLLGIRLRKVSPKIIMKNLISASKFGLNLTIPQLEAHYLAGGNVTDVVNALISAKEARINLDFQKAAAINLAGKKVVEAIQTSISPRSIKIPIVTAVAKDGMKLKVSAKVTVKTNLDNILGGAGEETIVSRIGEAIISAVGSSSSHKTVLENPNKITEFIQAKRLDYGTAYDIVSFDIVGIKPGIKDTTRELNPVEEYDNVFPINGQQHYSKHETTGEQYQQFNVYNYNDFILLLNNHIGLFRNTGAPFMIVSILLSEAAISKSLLTLRQLLNAVRDSIGKRDKIYVNNNRIIVLLVSGNSASVRSLIGKINNNLQISDHEILSEVLDQISIFPFAPDSATNDAENLLEYLLSLSPASGNSYRSLRKFMV